MSNLFFLIVCLLLGYVAQRANRLPTDSSKTITALIVQIAMPALVFRNIYPLQMDRQLLWAIVMPWLLFTVSMIFFGVFGWMFGWGRKTIGTLAVTAGFGNLSFIGLPMIEVFYGASWLGVAALSAQLGVNFATNTAGVFTAAYCGSNAGVQFLSVFRRIVAYPPFLAFLLAIALKPIEIHDHVLALAERLAILVAPLAMLTIGVQLGAHRDGRMMKQRGTLAAALLFKLVLAPAVAFAVIVWLAELRGPLAQIIIFQAALGPQVAGAIVAAEFQLDTRLSAIVIGLGTVLSMLSACGWYFVANAYL